VHQLFRNAIFNTAPVVFGLRLKPFSLAHAYVLEAFDSPYMRAGADPTIEDMALLVWVCSQDAYPFERMTAAMLHPRLQKKMARWGRRVRVQDIPGECDKVREYLTVGNDHPARHFKEGQRRDPRTPWPLVIFVKLKQAGISDERAWNQPLPMSTAIKLTVDWLGGDNSLRSEFEQQSLDAQRAALKDRAP